MEISITLHLHILSYRAMNTCNCALEINNIHLVKLLLGKYFTRANIRSLDFTHKCLFKPKGQLYMNVTGNNFFFIYPRHLHEGYIQCLKAFRSNKQSSHRNRMPVMPA